MYAIRNYTNTKCELEMAKTRLNLLMDRKEKLYSKYFPLTSKIKEIVVGGGDHNNDKMADYVSELYDVDIGTGMSLAEEIEYEQQNVDKLQSYIDKMDETLSKMSGIEYELFYEIVYNGANITKAVEMIAEKKKKSHKPFGKTIIERLKEILKQFLNLVTKYSEYTVKNVVKCILIEETLKGVFLF